MLGKSGLPRGQGLAVHRRKVTRASPEDWESRQRRVQGRVALWGTPGGRARGTERNGVRLGPRRGPFTVQRCTKAAGCLRVVNPLALQVCKQLPYSSWEACHSGHRGLLSGGGRARATSVIRLGSQACSPSLPLDRRNLSPPPSPAKSCQPSRLHPGAATPGKPSLTASATAVCPLPGTPSPHPHGRGPWTKPRTSRASASCLENGQ